MTTPIYQKIISREVFKPASVGQLSNIVKHHYNEAPSSLTQAEEWLTTSLQGLTTILFPAAPDTVTTNETEYTEIRRDLYPISIPISPIDWEPELRFYNAIITWEGYRIIETLIRNAENRKDDNLTRDDVKETLQQLQKVSCDAFNISQSGPYLYVDSRGASASTIKAIDIATPTFYFLSRYAFKIYYEISILFEDILVPEDVEPVRDFFNDVRGATSNINTLEDIVTSARIIHRVQQAVISGTADKSLLAPLYKCNDTITALKPTVDRLEDALYAKQLKLYTVSLRELKYSMTERISAVADSRTIISIMNDEILAIQELGISQESHSSQVAQYRCYLDEELKYYKTGIQHRSAQYGVALDGAESQKCTDSSAQWNMASTIPCIKKEELAPETLLVVTRAKEFKEKVKPFAFSDIPKVAALSDSNKEMLIQKIVGESVPYAVAILVYLGYHTYLMTTYKFKKTAVAMHLAECLHSNERTIRGNIAVLTNSHTTEDPGVYTAHKHEDEVEAYYNTLLNNNQ